MAGVPTHEDWKEIDEEMLEDGAVGSQTETNDTPKTPKPDYDYAESAETEQEVMTDGGISTDNPDHFYQPRLNRQKSALDGNTQFSDSSDEFLPESANLENHSRVSDLVRSQIKRYRIDGVYELGVTPKDIAEADSLTETQAEQLLENDISAEYDGTFDYSVETEQGTVYVNDTSVDGSKQRKEIDNGEIWA
jgi:hypothetical protein